MAKRNSDNALDMGNLPNCEAPKGMPKHKASESWFAVHDSIESFASLPASPANESASTAYEAGYHAGAFYWLGVGSVNEYFRVVKEGWAEGVAKLSAMEQADIEAMPVKDIRRRIVRADQGDEFDIHRAYSGGLDQAWSSRRRNARLTTPTVTLAAIIGEKCANSVEQVFWRGAAVAKLADVLSAAGYNVEIVAVASCYGFVVSGDEKSLFAHLIPVKRSDMPLDLTAVVTTIALPAFMRVSMFRAMRAFPRVTSRTSGTFGNPELQEKIARAMLDGNGYAGAYMVNSAIHSKDSAEAWINKTIRAIQGEDVKLAA